MANWKPVCHKPRGGGIYKLQQWERRRLSTVIVQSLLRAEPWRGCLHHQLQHRRSPLSLDPGDLAEELLIFFGPCEQDKSVVAT